MYDVSDLFDMRSAVGAKLEIIMSERSLTKAGLCSDAGISRPTLDKLLAASITNKSNYEKHIAKILKCLELTPDLLMGNSKNKFNRSRVFSNMLQIDENRLAESIGISVERLKDIEGGAEANLAELRDIALLLQTSVRSVQGTNYFEPQVSTLDELLTDYTSNSSERVGFWGHAGILPLASELYQWFPITANTHTIIYQDLDQDELVIPCMNNKLLLLNLKNIKNIALLEDACDRPDFANWPENIDCGETPLVVYEALDDYIEWQDSGEKQMDHALSAKFCSFMERFLKEKNISAEDLAEQQSTIMIYYADGRIGRNDINFSDDESLTDKISSVYEFGKDENDNHFLLFKNYDEAELLINWNTVSMIELPLLPVEDAICRVVDEMLPDEE